MRLRLRGPRQVDEGAAGGEPAGSVPDDARRSGNGPVRGARAVTIARSAPAALAAPIASAAATVRLRYQRWWWVPGWLFAAVTQLPALLAMAWLVPGTAMLVAGRLLPTPLLIIFVPLALALCYFAMGQLPVSWPRFGDSSLLPESAVLTGSGMRAQPGAQGELRVRARPPGRRPDVPADAVLATVAVAAGFAVWQAVYHSQQVIVVSDPGVYLQYGYWIAAHGSARIPESAAAFGSAAGLNFASLGFYASGGFITPAFMPGLPLVLAAGTWLGGVPGALLMAPVIGGCAVLSFAGLVGRLAGPRWAPAGALVLALTLPQQYVSRTPFSEPLVQVLLFGGLCLVTDSLVMRRRGYGGAAMALAFLGGLALGLTVLANIGSLGMLLPAFPVLAVMFVLRRPQAGPLGLGLFAGVACGLCAGLMLARPYLSSISPQLHLFGLCAAGFGVVTALAAPLAFPGVRARVRRVFMARTRARAVGLRGETLSLPSLGTVSQWVVFAVPVLALIGFAVRPYYQTTRGQTDPFVIRHVAMLQRLAHLPVDGRRQYYESSLDWVLWYLGIPAVLLATAGAAVLGRRLVRAALTWRESLIAARVWALPFLLIGWSVVTVLWDPAVLPDQPSASRRLVPVVLPGLILLAVWVSSRLRARAAVLGASSVTSALVGLCCVLAMTIPPFVTSMNPGLAARPSVGPHSSGLSKFVSRIRFQGPGASATYGGSVAAVSRLCSAIGADASVIFADTATANSFGQVVRGMCGQPAAVGSSAVTIEQAVTSVEHAGRRPVLLGASRARLAVFGVVPRKALSLGTAGDAHVLTGPPASTWPTSYTVWMAAPLGSGSASSGGV